MFTADYAEQTSWLLFLKYLNDLERIVGGHPQSRIDELLPWNSQQIGVKTAA